jgi:hypothetical protein
LHCNLRSKNIPKPENNNPPIFHLLTKQPSLMNLTIEQLRELKHKLPSGSMQQIASQLDIDEQKVRNFFGSNKGGIHPDNWHFEPGPQGGIVHFEDMRIYNAALSLIPQEEAPV